VSRDARLLHSLLPASAERAPDSEAVRFQDDSLSYGELDTRSNRLARALAEEGVALGDPVVLQLPKSTDAIVALLAIMKAGGCCVPVDPGTPPPRLRAILDQCHARVAIGSEETRDRLVEQPLERVLDAGGSTAGLSADPPAVTVTEQDLAYILFTSGSTGTPKGVELSHLNVRTFVDWASARFDFGPEDRFSNHAPLNFDLSTLDVFGALGAGASVTLVPERMAMFPPRLADFLQHERLTVWYSVPSVLTLLVTHGRVEHRDLSLRLVLFAGEVFPVRHLRDLMNAVPGPRYFNLFGPTETNVCTYHEVKLPPLGDTPVPIGKPCEGIRVVALDEEGHQVEQPGQEGVLHVGGPGVTPGYHGRPEETEAAFVTHDGARLYCTGDWVTIDEDGDFLFLGRRDHMIKSGGHRIELGEVEAALHSHPAIHEAVAVPVPDEVLGSLIRAVVVPVAPGALSEQDVRSHCAERLPRYMVPAEVELRAELPRTATQKVDRARLTLESVGTGGTNG
jgi:amino acid adenylation domain-containing protein